MFLSPCASSLFLRKGISQRKATLSCPQLKACWMTTHSQGAAQTPVSRSDPVTLSQTHFTCFVQCQPAYNIWCYLKKGRRFTVYCCVGVCICTYASGLISDWKGFSFVIFSIWIMKRWSVISSFLSLHLLLSFFHLSLPFCSFSPSHPLSLLSRDLSLI